MEASNLPLQETSGFLPHPIDNLMAKTESQRMKFRLAVMVKDIMQGDTSRPRKAIAAAAVKSKVRKSDEECRRAELNILPHQGHP